MMTKLTSVACQLRRFQTGLSVTRKHPRSIHSESTMRPLSTSRVVLHVGWASLGPVLRCAGALLVLAKHDNRVALLDKAQGWKRRAAKQLQL